MKMLNMILFFAAIMFAIAIFDFHPVNDEASLLYAGNYTNYTAGYNYSSYVYVNGTPFGTSTYSSNDIWQVFMHPTQGGGLSTVAMLIVFATWLAIIGLFNIFGFGYRSDLSMMGPLFIFFLGIGWVPIAIVYNFINRESAMYACGVMAEHCWISEMLAAVVAGSLFIMWIAACVEWWTQRSLSN